MDGGKIDKNDPLSFERLKISERLLSMEQTLKNEKELTRILLRKINGDPDTTPPTKGLTFRLEALEIIEKDREKLRDGAIKMAVGSATIAIGGAMIWIFQVLREAFIARH